jgi:RNA polymerase sigma-70 factor (ECF subfamily)
MIGVAARTRRAQHFRLPAGKVEDMEADESGRRRPAYIQELLARIKNGDEEAARELLTRYESKVRLVVRRQLPRLLRSRFDSLDFLQSVWGSFFYKIRTGPNDLDEEQSLVTFLAWAARNKVIDEYRRAATQRQDIKREEQLDGLKDKELCLASGDTPSQLAQAHETYDRLRDLLPEDQQVILEMRASGHSSKEIGARLGISERTVQRVLESLRVRARLGDRSG